MSQHNQFHKSEFYKSLTPQIISVLCATCLDKERKCLILRNCHSLLTNTWFRFTWHTQTHWLRDLCSAFTGHPGSCLSNDWPMTPQRAAGTGIQCAGDCSRSCPPPLPRHQELEVLKSFIWNDTVFATSLYISFYKLRSLRITSNT